MRKLSELSYSEIFFKGTILRNYINKELFYDYMLCYAPWEKNMLLINITKNNLKKGSAFGGTIPVENNDNFVVDRKGFEYTLGESELENWFLIEEDEWLKN